MGARQREWARRARLELIAALGGKCVECGATEALEIDHKFKRIWDPRKTDQSARLAIFRREAKLGLVTVRCRGCNAKKGEPEETAPAGANGQIGIAPQLLRQPPPLVFDQTGF